MSHTKRVPVFALALVVLLPSRLLLAQESVSRADALEEIVVTAERREGTVQKSSLAIQVITGEDLARSGVVSPRDLALLVPGMTVGTGGPEPQIYIRGVGDLSAISLSNPAIATNLDGVYLARPVAVNNNFFDVARIEVLKGPQGTLYGRNASGGAINVITVRPTFDGITGYASLDGGNFSERGAEGAINVPLASNFAVRGAFQLVSRDGYLSDGYDDDHHQAMRLQALWKPVDAASLLAGADYAHMGGNGAGFVYKPQPAGTSPWEGVTSGASNAQLNQAVVAAGLCAPAVAFPPGVAPTGACPPLPVGPGVSLPQVALFAPLNGGRKQDNKLWGVHAELNWDLGGTTLTILPAYRYSSETYTTLPTYPFYQAPAESRETTVEARLSGTTQRLKWVGGLYYFNEAQSYTSGVDAGLVQNVRYEVAPHTLSYAAFGQSTLSFTDNWRVITGVRFTSDERTINGQTFTVFPAVSLNPAAICLNPTEAFCLAESYQGHRTFDNMSWKIGLEHDVSDQSLLFVTASTGFKAGGFNQNVANSPAGSNAAQPYSPEKLLAFELGSKNRFLDQRLQLNVEGFYWRYTDHQEPHVLIDGLGNAAFQFSNAGRATMYGLDVDLQFKVASSDTVRLLVEAIAARYDSFEYTSAFQVNTGCGETSAAVYHINCSGFQMAHVSKWSGTASYSHHFDFGARGRVDLDLDGQYASARWLQIEFVPAERAPGYITGNVSLTYRPEAASWSISGYCRNVVDKAIYMSGNANAFGPALFGANIAPPRTFGARVRFDF